MESCSGFPVSRTSAREGKWSSVSTAAHEASRLPPSVNTCSVPAHAPAGTELG
jgi:hypothetical protein